MQPQPTPGDRPRLFDTFDFARAPSLDGSFQELRNGQYLKDGETIVILGGHGTGKTHLSDALAEEANFSGHTVVNAGTELLMMCYGGPDVPKHKIASEQSEWRAQEAVS